MVTKLKIEKIGEYARKISTTTGFNYEQIYNILENINQQLSIEFILYYRRGNSQKLNEWEIRQIYREYKLIIQFETRKQFILENLAEKNQLNDALQKTIESTHNSFYLEEVFNLYSDRVKNRSFLAKENNLQPLAQKIKEQQNISLENIAETFLNEKLGISKPEKAIEGALDIISQEFFENANLREEFFDYEQQNSQIKIEVSPLYKDKKTEFSNYYNKSFAIRQLSPFKLDQIFKGQKQNILKVSIILNDEQHLKKLTKKFVKLEPFKEQLKTTIEESYKRFFIPSLKMNLTTKLKKQIEDFELNAIYQIFKNQLLTKPIKDKIIMGAYINSDKNIQLCIVSPQKEVLQTQSIQSFNTDEGKQAGFTIIQALAEKYKLQAIAIINDVQLGALRTFFNECFKEVNKAPVCIMVNKTIPITLSSSKKTFKPNINKQFYEAFFIIQHLQNTLEGILEIDGKRLLPYTYKNLPAWSIQKKLEEVVKWIIHWNGIDINTAPVSLLSEVSGINKKLAENIVQYRKENGNFKDRSEFVKVPNFNAQAFKLSAGFLTIAGQNILDKTRIHPEQYEIVTKICEQMKITLEKIPDNISKIKSLNFKNFEKIANKDTLFLIQKQLSQVAFKYSTQLDTLQFPIHTNIDSIESGANFKGIITHISQSGILIDIGFLKEGFIRKTELDKKRFVIGDIISTTFVKHNSDKKHLDLKLSSHSSTSQTTENSKLKKHTSKKTKATIGDLKSKFDTQAQKKSNNTKLKISIKEIMRKGR